MKAQEIINALKRLDIPEYRNLDNEDKEIGYRQMCQDLMDLAEKDGCVGAAFALSVFSAIAQRSSHLPVTQHIATGINQDGSFNIVEVTPYRP